MDEETTARLRNVAQELADTDMKILLILPEVDNKFEYSNEAFNNFAGATLNFDIPPLPNQLFPVIRALKNCKCNGYVSFTIPLKGSDICLVKKAATKPAAASWYACLDDNEDDDEVFEE